MSHAIGMVELSSIAAGFSVQDAMLKAAAVDLILARTICSGKFVIIVGGSVSSVTAALAAGEEVAGGYLIEQLTIPNIDRQVFAALAGTVIVSENSPRALGIVETFAATPIIEAADAAVKAADVTLLRVHVSMAIGGKGFLVLNGDTSAVQAAVDSAVGAIKSTGMLVHSVVIPAASRELLKEYL